MAKNDYSRERSWILKKLNSGNTTQNELLNCVGAFSNKKKERVMQEKRLSEKDYKKRYNFLGNVYYLLSNESFDKKYYRKKQNKKRFKIKQRKKLPSGQMIDGIYESDFAMQGAAHAAKKYNDDRERKAAKLGIKLPF